MSSLTFTGTFHLVRRGHGGGQSLSAGPPKPKPPKARPLAVARMLAVAHRLAARVAAGETVTAIAGRLGFTTARVSQLLDLVLLEPSIQERLLLWTTESGHDRITERALRDVVRHRDWSSQRTAFDTLVVDSQHQQEQVARAPAASASDGRAVPPLGSRPRRHRGARYEGV